MKQITLSAFIIITFILYGAHQHSKNADMQIAVPKNLAVLPSAAPTSAQPIATAMPTSISTPTSTSAGKYKNGTFTGSVADANYGSIQVQIIVQSGLLAQVKFLQYPNERSTSRQINEQAMPYLQQEAIKAQSAQVDGVSGASYTSGAFIESLSSALNQARNI